MVSVYRVALLLKVMMSTNAQSALKKEKKEVCSPRGVDRAWLFLTHHDLLSLFEVSSQVSLKPLARQMLERSRFPKRGHCQQKREKTTWTWKPARQFRLPQKKAGPRESGNPRGIKSIPCHPFMASIYNFPPIHCKHETRGSVDR